MKLRTTPLPMALLLALATFLVSGLAFAQSQTNIIHSPGGNYYYTVNNGTEQNPTLHLKAGVTNVFIIETDFFHPVAIVTNLQTFDYGVFYANSEGNPTSDGTITLAAPNSPLPPALYYMCYWHGFYGVIDLTALVGPIPPPNTIVQIQVGTNVIMTSTSTNSSWSVVPEYSSNLHAGVWAPVSSFNNTYTNGTNTTVFDRLDPICGPNVYLRLRQQQN